jgi:heat shock protein HtpX
LFAHKINMIRTAVMLSIMTAILLGAGFLIAGMAGMLAALVLAFCINFLSYWYSDTIVLRLYRAKRSDDKELNEIVRSMAREAGIPKPRVYMVPSEVPNAFATGRNPEHSAVAVTQGLTMLTHDEMTAVIAHEISHIRNRDTLIQTVSATIAGAIAFLAQFGYWSLFLGRRKDAGTVIGLILIVIFAPLAAIIIRLAISRRREYRADFTGAVLSKKPLQLASALRKISEVSRENPIHGSPATEHLWIVSPFKPDWFSSMFSTHPPLKRRIAKLERIVVKKGEVLD